MSEFQLRVVDPIPPRHESRETEFQFSLQRIMKNSQIFLHMVMSSQEADSGDFL